MPGLEGNQRSPIKRHEANSWRETRMRLVPWLVVIGDGCIRCLRVGGMDGGCVGDSVGVEEDDVLWAQTEDWLMLE